MVNTVEIDKSQAAAWAKEETLKKILSESISARALLEKGLDLQGINKDIVDEIKKAAIKDAGSVETQTNSFDDIFGRGSRLQQAAITGLGTSLGKSFNILSSALGGQTGLASQLGSAAHLAGTALTNTSTNLTGLSKIVTGLTGKLFLFGVAIFETWDHVVDINNNFNKLYDVGINLSGGLDSLTETAFQLGLTTAETAKALVNFSSSVVYLGTNRTVQLIKQFRELTKQGAEFAYSNEEAAAALLEYTDMLRGTGVLRSMSDRELVKNAKEFNQQLTLSAEITGKSRKELEKQLNAQMKQPDVAAQIRALPEALQKLVPQIDAQFSMLGAGGETLSKAFIAAASTGPQAVDDVTRTMLVATNTWGTFMESVDKFKAGNADVTGALMDMTKQMSRPELADFMNNIAASGGSIADSAKLYQQITVDIPNTQKAFNKLEEEVTKYINTHDKNMSREEARNKVVEQQQKDTVARNSDMTRVHNKLQEASAKLSDVFDKLLVNVVEPLLPAMNALMDGVIWLSERFHDVVEDLIAFRNTLPTIFSGMREKIASIIPEWVPNIWQSFKDFVDKLLSSFSWIMSPTTSKKESESPVVAPKSEQSRTLAESLTDIGIEAGGALLAAKFLKGFFKGKKDITAAPEAATSPEAEAISEKARTVIDSIESVNKGLGSSIKSLSVNVGESLSALGKGVGDGIRLLTEGIAGALGPLTKAMGSGVVALAEGAGTAIQVLGRAIAGLGSIATEIFKGSAALAAAIALIGGAIAADIWMMGAALPTMSAGLASFTTLDSAKLGEVGTALEKLAMGMIKFGAGELTSAAGGFSSWITSFMQADPLTKIKEFSALSSEVPAMNAVSDALNKFAESYKNLSESLKLPIPENLSLKNLGSITVPTGSSQTNAANLSKVVQDLQSVVENIKPIATAEGAAPVGGATSDALASKTMQFYDQNKLDSKNMNDLLIEIKYALEVLNNSINTQTSALSRSITKASPIIT